MDVIELVLIYGIMLAVIIWTL